ncbi:hypothetical protein DICVIV_14338, partial [Dictyocaulus viviparus]
AKAIMLPYALRHLSRAEDWLAEQWELRLANFLITIHLSSAPIGGPTKHCPQKSQEIGINCS